MTAHRSIPGLFLLALLASACSGPIEPTEVIAAPVSTIPVLLSPSDGAVLDNGCTSRTDGISWDFDWSDVQHATKYHLVVRRVGASFPVIDAFTSASSYQYTSAGAYVIEQNRFDWQWKVEAEVNSAFADYSPVNSFSVEPVNADCR